MFSLPAELRQEIFTYVLTSKEHLQDPFHPRGADVLGDTTQCPRRCLEQRYVGTRAACCHGDECMDWCRDEMYFTALLRTCKRIRQEAEPLLLRKMTFTFSEPRTALNFAARQQHSDPIGYQRTTHLGIKMRARHRQDFCINATRLFMLDWKTFFSDAKMHCLGVHTLTIDIANLTYMLE